MVCLKHKTSDRLLSSRYLLCFTLSINSLKSLVAGGHYTAEAAGLLPSG